MSGMVPVGRLRSKTGRRFVPLLCSRKAALQPSKKANGINPLCILLHLQGLGCWTLVPFPNHSIANCSYRDVRYLAGCYMVYDFTAGGTASADLGPAALHLHGER